MCNLSDMESIQINSELSVFDIWRNYTDLVIEDGKVKAAEPRIRYNGGFLTKKLSNLAYRGATLPMIMKV